MINFLTENTTLPTLDQPKVERWIRAVAAGYGFAVGDITYILCDDEKILAVNRQFLGHDYYTDVITLDTVAYNAEQVGVAFEDELLRILIHGVLHLTGQADKTPETKAQMTAKEEQALALWHKR